MDSEKETANLGENNDSNAVSGYSGLSLSGEARDLLTKLLSGRLLWEFRQVKGLESDLRDGEGESLNWDGMTETARYFHSSVDGERRIPRTPHPYLRVSVSGQENWVSFHEAT